MVLNRLKKYDYLTFSSDMNFLLLRRKSQFNNGIFKRAISFFINFLKSLKCVGGTKPEADFVFFWGTKNQKSALLYVLKEMKSRGVKCEGVSLSPNVVDVFNIPSLFSYILSLLIVPLVIFELLYKCRNKYFLVQMSLSLDSYILSYGQEIVFRRYLKCINPVAVVLSNDHNPPNRVLISLCKEMGIKTIYIQHSSVSSYFPPLSQFDSALLDGLFSKDIYERIGSLPLHTELVGISKFDFEKRLTHKESHERFVVGIALNAMYEPDLLVALIKNIDKSRFCIKLRVHPGQINEFDSIKQLLAEFDIIYSMPEVEKVSSFILSVGVLIAGNSGILLESQLLGVMSVHILLDGSCYDYYGFVKNGVSLSYDGSGAGINDLLSQVFSGEINQDVLKLKYYDESIGSDFYGYSAMKSADVILSTYETCYEN